MRRNSKRPSSTTVMDISEVPELIQLTANLSWVDVNLEGKYQCLRDENYLLKKSCVSFCEASFQENNVKVKF